MALTCDMTGDVFGCECARARVCKSIDVRRGNPCCCEE